MANQNIFTEIRVVCTDVSEFNHFIQQVMYLTYCIVFVSGLVYCMCVVELKSNETIIIGKMLFTIFNNEPYAAFYNIPYAEPPVEDLRFKPPKEKLDLFGQQSHDYSEYYTDSIFGLEDCLHLSIYTPMSGNMTKYFPVLVWIGNHSIDLRPDFFIDEEVIIVVIKYRTNIFGFLNTGDNFAEGNMGAKDVVTALKWLQNNISYFKGYKDKITLLGHGNSATLVASMLVSPMAENLFTRAIVLDGSAMSPADYRSYNFEIAYKLYWKLKGRFDKFDRKELYESLRNMHANDLIALSGNLYDSSEVRDNQRPIKSFSCSVETSKNAFMNKTPMNFYDNKKINKNVEVIFGYTNLVSLYQLHGLAKNKNLLKYLNYNFQYLLPFEGKSDEYDSKRYKKIRNSIMEFFFLNGTIGERSLRRYAKYLSDQVLYPMLRQAVLQSDATPVYLYRFSFKGSLNMGWSLSVPELKWKGATLGDEICYLFRCKSVDKLYTSSEGSNERQFITRIVKLFANFVKYGNPTPETKDIVLGNLKWHPMDKKNMQALRLSRRIKMINVPEVRRMKFWDELKRNYF